MRLNDAVVVGGVLRRFEPSEASTRESRCYRGSGASWTAIAGDCGIETSRMLPLLPYQLTGLGRIQCVRKGSSRQRVRSEVCVSAGEHAGGFALERRHRYDETMFAMGGRGIWMNNYEILQRYSRGDLRRLAKGKISEIVGLDADKVLRDLSKVLGNYESVKRNVEFRMPPTDTILEVLVEADGYRLPVDRLKTAVKGRIKQYEDAAKSIDVNDPSKGYRLYARMMEAAWEHEGDLVPSEANLLRVLRDELHISRTEHHLVMAHPDLRRLAFSESDYEDELGFLTSEGIVLVYSDDGDSWFVLSDETAESVLQLWGYEMRNSQFERLLSHLSKTELTRTCQKSGLKTSGSIPELIGRIIEAHLAPSAVLDGMPTPQVVALLGKLSLPKGGNKEERILRAGVGVDPVLLTP